jgi:hypothetical protein
MGERARKSYDRSLTLVAFAAAYEPDRHENASALLLDAEAGLIELSTIEVA